jgi:hypothetical protein
LGGINGPRNFWERLLWPLPVCRERDGRGWRHYAEWPWRHPAPYPATKACPEALVTGELVEVRREPCRSCKGTDRLQKKNDMGRLQLAIALLTGSLWMQVTIGDHVLLAVGQPLPDEPAPKDFAAALRALASKIDAANLGWDDEQQA